MKTRAAQCALPRRHLRRLQCVSPPQGLTLCITVTRSLTTVPPRQSAKDLFSIRSGAKEGLWVAHNSNPRIPASVAARLSPAVQLLEAERDLAGASTSPSMSRNGHSDDAMTLTAAALRRKARARQQQQQQHQEERERMARILRERQRERDKAGKPLFWIDNPSAATSASSSMISPRMPAVSAFPSDSSGRSNDAPDSAVPDRRRRFSSFLMLLVGLPVMFSLGRRYEVTARGGIDTAPKTRTTADGEDQEDAYEVEYGLIGGVEDIAKSDNGEEGSASSLQFGPEEGNGGRGNRRGDGWFWSSSDD